MGWFTKKRTGPGYGGYAPTAGPSTYDIVGDVKWKKAKNGQFYPTFKNVHGVLNPASAITGMAGPTMAAPVSACGPTMASCGYGGGACGNYGYGCGY